MKKNSANLRMMAVLGVLLLLTQACKKDPFCPDPEPEPGCRLAMHLVEKLDPNSPSNPPYRDPYQFTRGFGSDGKVIYLDLNLILFSPYDQRLAGPVSHVGNHVIMQNASGDTLLDAELNRHGLPVTLFVGEHSPFFGNHRFTFQYDNRNRLIRSSLGTYEYDQYGNVTKITNGGYYIKFTHDYSRPIKGGYYEVGGMGNTIPWDALVMELLGHLRLMQPHHIVTGATTTHYPEGTWTYVDQEIDADGYLVSYKTNLEGGGDPHLKGTLIWNCNSIGGKY